MFLHLSVILFTGGRGSVHPCPPRQTSPGRHPQSNTPLGRHPSGRHLSPRQTPPFQTDTPQATTAADITHSTGMQSFLNYFHCKFRFVGILFGASARALFDFLIILSVREAFLDDDSPNRNNDDAYLTPRRHHTSLGHSCDLVECDTIVCIDQSE